MPDDGYNYFSEYVFVRLHILYIDLKCIMQKMTDEFTKNWQLLLVVISLSILTTTIMTYN